MNKIMCFLTGGHRFKSKDTQCHGDNESRMYTITEACCKCGKKFSFSAQYKDFGLPEEK